MDSMKTRFLSLFTLCGVVASFGFVARAIESNPPQPSDTTSAVPASAAPQFSGGINDVVALSKSGVDESIVLSFIRNSPGPFTPSADEIIKLRDMGVSTPVLTAMLQRGGELRDQAHAAVAAAAADQANNNPSQAPVITETPPSTYAGGDNSANATQPASTVTYIGGDYSYPYYSYPYYPYYSGWYSTAFFYPFPCWFGGVFYAHGCFFPHGGFVHDDFHVHDGHGGFHGDSHGDTHGGFHGDTHGGFHGGDVHSGFHGTTTGGFHGGMAGGFHSGVTGGFHGGTVSSSGFHGGTVSSSGFHTSPMSGGFHSAPMGGGGFSGGGAHMGGGGGGFHGGGGGGHR